MPAGKIYRVPYKRRRYVRKKKPDMKLATVGRVKRLIRSNIETKYLQGAIGPIFVDWTGSCFQLNILPQGTDEGQRIGDMIRMTNIDLRYSVFNATSNFTRVRLIMFVWRMETNTSPIASDILATNGNTLSVISTYNLRNERRYRILYDQVHVLTSPSAITPIAGTNSAVGGTPVFDKRIRKSLKNMVGQYAGPAGTDDMSKGYLGFLFVSDVSTAASNAQKPQLQYHYTLKYKDS